MGIHELDCVVALLQTLHDQVELVLDEYVHLPLVDEFVDFEINLTGFGSKN